MKWNKKKIILGIHAFYKVIANLPKMGIHVMDRNFKLRSILKKKLYWLIGGSIPITLIYR